MTTPNDITKYDDALTSILVNEKSILGFLSTIFGFLARRTDFYYVPEGPYENMGFPPGVAEEIVIKVLRTCNPNNFKAPNGARKPADVNNEIMCSTVAQEIEIDAAENEVDNNVEISKPPNDIPPTQAETTSSVPNTNDTTKSIIPKDYVPPIIPVQSNTEAYNGAVRDKYSWSQTIMDIDVIVKLPPDIKSAKDLKVIISAGDISVTRRNGDVIIKDTLPYKIRTADSFWSMSEGRLLMHLEKAQEHWWCKLLDKEEPIDLSKIDCSRPLNELPEDHIAKIRELQWNQEQKMQGLPTSDEIRNIEILKKAWNAEGSPFKGKEFDLSIFKE